MQTMQSWGRVKLTEVNPHLVCVLCHGYFIDATTMAECPHSFCRSCILLYLETKSYCPICEVQIHKTKPHLNLKPDKTLQDIVYKLVPGLYHSEMKRRREFYQTKYPNRDLDLGPEARGVGVERIIYSPEDLISLSLEYYDEKDEFDLTDQIAKSEDITITYEREREEWARTRPESFAASSSSSSASSPSPSSQTEEGEDGLKKRFLQCPAVLNMRLLKKFIRIKYGLSPACTVEILYRRESLPDSYSLMDVAYIYTWKRNNPMRFYYRIHVPTTLRKILPPLKASSEPIKDTTPNKKLLKSPELLDAVGLRPKIWFEDSEDGCTPPLSKIPKLDLDSKPTLKVEAKSGDKEDSKKDAKSKAVEEKEKLQMSTEETAKSLLMLRNGHRPKEPEQTNDEGRSQSGKEPAVASRPPTSNGGVFKVPPNMTKRFFINGGKLVAVNPKTAKNVKSGDKKVNGELLSVADRFSNPLGLSGGPFGMQGGKLPPGSPRPPPNSDKLMNTKYMSPNGYLLNRVTPDVTFSQNKIESEPNFKKPPNLTPTKPKQMVQSKPPPLVKSDGGSKAPKLTNGQPVHRKEPNRLEQIVQNCLKKEKTQKSVGEAKSGKEAEVQNDNSCVKRSGTLNAGSGESDARAAQSIRPTDHPSRVDTKEEPDKSILKRKLNDPPFNRRPMPPLSVPNKDSLGDVKNRRLVTPDVSIELMANPAKDNQTREKKKEPTDLTTLTNRFLHDIQRMNKKPESEIRINKPDQMCASIVNIEKVPAPSSQQVSSPKSSPNGTDASKISDGSDFSSEDPLFIDIKKKCVAMKRKSTEQASIAIERVSKDEIVKTNSKTPPLRGSDVPTSPASETPAKPSGTHKKLPRLIEINAPPRPKPPALLSDPKQKTGLKMTTVRKEVPIGKEGPQVKRDNNGALDLSSGLSPPNPKSDKTPNRPGNGEKTPTPPALSPLLSMTTFPMPETNRSPPIRIPSLKPKTSPNPRPSSLSSSSPSPPAPGDSRSAVDTFTSAAYQQLMRQQMEFQSRIFASVNNNWSRDPMTAKKMDDWMRNVMNLPHHPLMFPNQNSPEARK